MSVFSGNMPEGMSLAVFASCFYYAVGKLILVLRYIFHSYIMHAFGKCISIGELWVTSKSQFSSYSSLFRLSCSETAARIHIGHEYHESGKESPSSM